MLARSLARLTFPRRASVPSFLRFPNHNFCPSSGVRCRRPKRELCRFYVRRAPKFKIRNADSGTDGRTETGKDCGPGAENYDERRERDESKGGEKYARLLPIGAVSHAVSPVLHLLRATFTPFTAAPPKLSLSRRLSNYVLFSMHPRISRTVPGKFLRPGGGGGGGGMNA